MDISLCSLMFLNGGTQAERQPLLCFIVEMQNHTKPQEVSEKKNVVIHFLNLMFFLLC